MRLFISYARVDKPLCMEIVEILDTHEVWFDQRLYAGQQWWKEITDRLRWCEGFVYLLSPESVASEYCRKEYEIAKSSGKHIFPVIIQSNTVVPDDLGQVQYADLSEGVTSKTVKVLLDSIYVAERRSQTFLARNLAPANMEMPTINASTALIEAVDSMEDGDFDRAVFLIQQILEQGYSSQYIDIEAMLADAENELEAQALLREAEREYTPIAALVKGTKMREQGCKAFGRFRLKFPDYDPQNLAKTCFELSHADVGVRGASKGTHRTRTSVTRTPPSRVTKTEELYFYPNKWARVMLTAAEEIMGAQGVAALLNFSGMTHLIGNYPPDNMKKEFSFENVGRLQQSIWDMYGNRGARVFATRAGEQSFKDGLTQFKSVAAAAQVAMKVGTLDGQAKLGLEFFSRFFNSVSDQVVEIAESDRHWLWTITRCPVCWGRKTNEPCCHYARGILMTLFTWVSNGHHFRIEEKKCHAVGDRYCQFAIDKMPID